MSSVQFYTSSRKLGPIYQNIILKLLPHGFCSHLKIKQDLTEYGDISLSVNKLFIPKTILFLLRHIKSKTELIPSPTILSTSTDCLPPCSLLSDRTSSPLSCSLLMYRLSVQRRKACLLRWGVSKKGRQPVRCPSLPLLQFSRQNNRSLSTMQSLLAITPNTSHASVMQSAHR